MRIIRFVDQQGDLCLGDQYDGESAVLLRGRLFAGLETTGERRTVAKILAPLEPAALLCIGLNYRQHIVEYGAAEPAHPVLFMKNPSAVQNPDDPILIPRSCLEPPQVDYEVELAVVIGRQTKNVGVAEALDAVFGYTVGNDVSARRWQKHGGGGQWVRGKSFDTFCPLGPVLVTADEIDDPQNLRLRCELNGRVMQEASTADMIFSVAQLISFLSEDTTLLPGTVIMTGTPSGVGFARDPAVFLKPGDVVAMSIDEIGILKNRVSS